MFKKSKHAPKAVSSPETAILLSITYPIKKLRAFIKRLYAWTIKWAAHPRANLALFSISFAESSFFPLPPDPLLIATTFAKPKKWWRLAFLTIAGSVLGGLFGYFIGYALFESIGGWLIRTLHLQSGFASVEQLYIEQSFWAVFAAAFTPIPYKIFTIAAGVFQINLLGFIFASLLGRGMRFLGVAGAAAFLGEKYKDKIERSIDLISLGLLAIIIVVVILFRVL